MTPDGSRQLLPACLAAALALSAADLGAQSTTASPPAIYTCTDADGRVISSDRPIPACARRPMRELNPDGSLRRIIAAPLSREQEREQAAQDRLRSDEAVARRIQQSRDRNLLMTFEDELALESMRRRSLAVVDIEIRLAARRILALDSELKIAREEADRWVAENPSKELPHAQRRRIDESVNAILAEDALIADRRAERERIERRFDADAGRLRELLGPPATPERSRSPRG